MPYYPRIRNLREDKDLTQTQMGEILSCSQRVYSNYERGDIDIPTATLIRPADFHKVSLDYLLNRTNNPQINKKQGNYVFGVALFFHRAASSIFSIKIPYPLVGSFTRTWVTAPTSLPS